MDKIKQLYEGLLNDGKLTSATSFESFKSTFNDNEDYRKSLYNGLIEDGDFTKDYDTFVSGYTEVKNIDPSTTASQELPKSDFKLQDVSLDKELFQDDEENKSGYRTYMTLSGLKTEKDTDGQYIKGTMGDIISMLPMGDFIDDQARAWGAGAEDRDVQEVAQEMMNSSKPTVEQAERMLNEMYQARTLPPSDEWKKFTSVINENGGDAFAAVKAVYASPSGAQEAITRSVSAMANWNNLEVAGLAAGGTIAAGAATGMGFIPSLFMALPAAMASAGANTDLTSSYAEFFAEELGDNYTREDLKSLIEDPERIEKIENRAMARGFSIAAISGLTAGIGTSVAANVFRNGRRGIKASAEAFAKVTPIDMAGGFSSEFFAQATSGQELNTGEMALEGLLDPMASLSNTIGGLGVDIASKPSYQINKGPTTKAEFVRRLNSMTDEQVKKANFKVNNDESVFAIVDERMSKIKLQEEVSKVYKDMSANDVKSISELEYEKKNISKGETEVSKNRVKEINDEIGGIVENYKTQKEQTPVIETNETIKEESEVDLAPKTLRNNVQRITDAISVKKIKRKIRRTFLETFTSGGGLDVKSEETLREFARKATAVGNQLKMESAIFTNQFEIDTKKMTPEQSSKYAVDINDYLSGKKDIELSPEMKPVLDEMRSQIDLKTDQLINLIQKIGRPGEDLNILLETLQSNKGSYLSQSYSAFKDLSYMQELISDPSMARSEINESYELLVAETAMDQEISIDEAQQQVDQYIADTFNSADRGATIASLAEGKIVSPFLKKKNPNLSQAFKNFLGEINDPLYNYANTIEKVSSYIAAVEYQSKFADYILQTGIGSKQPNRDSGKLIKLENGDKFKFLNEIYVDQDFADAYKSIQKLSPVEGFMRYIIAVQGGVKYGKTIVSPMTTSRNFISGSMITMLNGENILYPGNYKQAAKAMKLAWNSPKNQTEIKAEVTQLIELGILQDGGRAQEIIEIINDIYVLEDKSRKKILSSDAVKKFNDGVIKLYQFGDDYFKTFNFYQKREKFLEYGMSIQEANEKAAYRVRKGMPTYSELPLNMRKLRRNPLVSTFVSFPYLITKAHKENLIFIAEDFKEGRTKMAMNSLANMTAALAIPAALSAGTAAYFGIDDDEEKAIKDMGPKYNKDAMNVYIGKDTESNEIQYFDINTIAPSAQIVEGISILATDRHGRNLPNKLKDAAWSQLSPYLDYDITTSAGIALATGKDPQTGKNVGEPLSSEAFAYAVDKISPSAIRNAANIARSQGWLGLDEINKFTGKQYTVEDELLALLGFRTTTTNWDLQLQSYAKGQSIDFSNEAKGQIKNIKKQQMLPLSEINDVVADMYEKNIEYSGNLLHQISAAQKFGLTESEIVNALSGSGLRSTDINSLMKGQFMEMPGIGTEAYKKEIEALNNRPDLAKNIQRNLDAYQFLVSQKNYDGKVKSQLYGLVTSGAKESEVLDLIKKSSKDIFKRAKTEIGSDSMEFSQKDISQAENKSLLRYAEIYKSYKALNDSEAYKNLPISVEATVNMIYETDPEIQSYLMYKFLDGKTDDKSILGLNELYKSVTKRNMSDTVFKLLKYRIKNSNK